MARVVGVYNTAHTPFCYAAPENWSVARARRSLRVDVPAEDLEIATHKSGRIQRGFATLRQKLAEARPDVLVIFGDDQLECFDFSNYPAFAIYAGSTFEGIRPKTDGTVGYGDPRDKATVKGHPELAAALLTGTMQRRFDPAFMLKVPKPDHGIGHAFMNPTTSLTDGNTAVVPILVNCYYAPQVTAQRCYEFGAAIRQAINDYDADLRVAVIGSGGLWHTPLAEQAWLNEDFDREILRRMAAGDARGMAEHFDAYVPAVDDRSQPLEQSGRDSTGLPSPGGPQNGTRETCNWIAAAAVAEGTPATIIDYVPVYSSPIGTAFAYWQLI